MTFGKRPHGPEQLRAQSDEEWRRELVKGNHEAFLVLFDRYWLDVFRLAHAVLRNKGEAEDLVQDGSKKTAQARCAKACIEEITS
jgi:DNA-directed RNA polymerase specialized sigma24 family protein